MAEQTAPPQTPVPHPQDLDEFIFFSERDLPVVSDR